MKKERRRERIFYIGDDAHTLCIGTVRSGKSRSVVLESICWTALAGESMVISDPKGELYDYTYPFLQEKGYKVLCLDFKNPNKSDRYNFLQPVINAINAEDIPKATECAWDITAAMVGEAKGEKIWTNGEASTIAGSIMNVVYDNRDEHMSRFQNMTNTYYFIANMYRSNQYGMMPITEYMNTLSNNHPSRGLIAISEIAPTRTRGSFFTSALTTLRLFTSPNVFSMTNQSDFNLEDIGREKTALFIILPDEKTTYYSLASLFVSQVYEKLIKVADERGGRLERRVNFILDEFGNFTQIPDFANKLTVGIGRGIRFNLFLQSFAQLDEKYGKEASKIIRGNCQNWIYLQAEDLETLEEISKKLGNYTTTSYSKSASSARYSNSSSQSINLISRPLLTPNEIRAIKRPYSLVIGRGNPAIMYAPDLSQYSFNGMLGMGDKEHNRKLREVREKQRPERKISGEMDLWNIWKMYK